MTSPGTSPGRIRLNDLGHVDGLSRQPVLRLVGASFLERGLPETPSRVAFSTDKLPVFQEVSRVFKAKSPREGFELEGAIIRLDRQGDEGPGRIRVLGAVDTRTRKVEVELPEDQFERAIQAFKTHTPVRAVGELARAGRKYLLKNPRGFETLPDEE